MSSSVLGGELSLGQIKDDINKIIYEELNTCSTSILETNTSALSHTQKENMKDQLLGHLSIYVRINKYFESVE